MPGWAPPGPEELLAHSRHPSRPFTTLRQILADAPLGVPRKYRALVRVVDYSPQDPAQMCSSSAECGLESDAGGAGRQGGCLLDFSLSCLLVVFRMQDCNACRGWSAL